MAERYFAQREASELVDYLCRFNLDFSSLAIPSQNGIGAVWARNINYYYNNVLLGDSQTGLDFDGQQGELVKMLVPQARSLNTQFLSLTTKQKLNFEPEALSVDSKTLADTRVAASLCSDLVRFQNIDQKAYRLAEISSLMGTAYLFNRWMPSLGKQKGIDPNTGQVAYSGGPKISVHTSYDLSFDHTIEDFYEQDWVTIKVLENRWNLIATHPELEDEIRQLPRAMNGGDAVFFWQMNMNEDMVWVNYFYHRSTQALPLGRHTVYCNSKTVFYDDDNPYIGENGAYIPITEMKPEPIIGTGFGYPIFSNILPLQEMLDFNFSSRASNNNAFAVKSVLNPTGNDINVKHIQGLKFINYTPMNVSGGGKPEVLELNNSNTEIANFSSDCVSYMQQIYSLNSAIRGEPGAGITSGTAIATLSANALEFAQNFTKSYVNCLEQAMYQNVLNYKNFSTEPMTVSITGPSNSSIAKQFIGSDLSSIRRVKLNISNPLMATAAGKLEVANNLLQTGQFTIEKYIRVLEGAPIEALYEDKFDEEDFIQQENDALRDPNGPMVKALVTDDHPEHIRGHKCLLDNVDIRNDASLSQKALDHIYEHYELAKTTDPILYQMIKTGQMPQQMPPPEQPQGGAPTAGPGPQDMSGAGAAPAQPAAPLTTVASEIGGEAPQVLGEG